MDLRPELLKALIDLGYEEPTPIQSEAIPVLLSGSDLIGQAATGTGKTAAFALPILNQVDNPRRRNPMALVLVPTRELAMQVSEAMHRYGHNIGARVVPIYGGAPLYRQLQALDRGVDIVVATPGRALDHIDRGSLKLDELEVVVLDEADEMMDMGFAEELEAILDATPSERQTVMFSATMPRRIENIASKYLRDPQRIRIQTEIASADEPPRVRQTAYIVGRAYKAAAIARILDVEVPDAAIVFCRTREQVDTLTNTLNGRGYRAEALHGGMNQEQRERVLKRLRAENAELLIATDVAARGLDIDHLTHVINYDVPASVDTYVHRIGRVGRAGREGVAITITEPREHHMLKTIERVTKLTVNVESLPTIAEVRTARLDLTTAAIRETLVDGELDDFRVVVETLSDEFDIVEVALAAVKLVHGANADEAEEEIPVIDLRDKKGDRKNRKGKNERERDNGPRDTGPKTKIFVNAGRAAGMRPGDLVGAIAGETSVGGKQIGSIEIADRFSLVEVPSNKVNEVISALAQTTIKGKKVKARRDKPRK
jgi:ATP-dependent RNA helicase DeaD